MALGLTKETISNGIPVFQDVEWNVQGGFTLDKTGLTDGQVILAGTPMSYSEATRLARPLKGAVTNAVAGGTDVTYHVAKGSLLAVGDYVSAAVGGTSYAITAIDTSNAGYDVITVGTTLGITTSGTPLFGSAASGATAGAYAVSPAGLLYEDEIVATNAMVSIVVEGVVYARRIPAYHSGIPALMPNIIFSQSF